MAWWENGGIVPPARHQTEIRLEGDEGKALTEASRGSKMVGEQAGGLPLRCESGWNGQPDSPQGAKADNVEEARPASPHSRKGDPPMIWRRIRELLGGEIPERDPDAIWLYVQCGQCGAPVAVRADRRYDLNPDETGAGYVLIKEIMDNRCFRLMRAEVHLDAHYRVLERSIEGGRFLSPEEYDQLRGTSEGRDPLTSPG